ncbi:MAG: phosphate acetyltransferase [Pseudoclavibacter sp.]
MKQFLFVLGDEAGSGASQVTLAVLDSLAEQYSQIALIRPVGTAAGDADTLVASARTALGAKLASATALYAERQAVDAFRDDPEGFVMDVLTAVEKLTADADVVVIAGAEAADADAVELHALNAELAREIGTRVVSVVDASGLDAAAATALVKSRSRLLAGEHLHLAFSVALGTSAADDAVAVPVADDLIAAWKTTAGPQTALDAAASDEELPVGPLHFRHGLIERARKVHAHIVLPEGDEPRTLTAAGKLVEDGIVEITLLGKAGSIAKVAAEVGVDVSKMHIIDIDESDLLEPFAEQFAELRKKKGVTVDQARETMHDLSYFGTMMIKEGKADGMVSGAVHTTANTIRPALQIVKTAPGTSTVSSVFIMCLADKVLFYGDCAVNISPTPEQSADIAIASAETAKQFGFEPRVALLSYSSGTSGSGPLVDAVREATELVKQRAPELAVEGPIQYDAASNLRIGSQKLPDSPVAGRANVFVFPDLNAGNNGYKAVQQSSGAVAIGPVLQGIARPVNDLSRGTTVDDVINTILITAIQSEATK